MKLSSAATLVLLAAPAHAWMSMSSTGYFESLAGGLTAQPASYAPGAGSKPATPVASMAGASSSYLSNMSAGGLTSFAPGAAAPAAAAPTATAPASTGSYLDNMSSGLTSFAPAASAAAPAAAAPAAVAPTTSKGYLESMSPSGGAAPVSKSYSGFHNALASATGAAAPTPGSSSSYLDNLAGAGSRW